MARRRVVTLAAGGLLALAAALLATTGAAMATTGTDLHQTPPISWDATGYSGDCAVTPGPGQVVWHFVLTSPADSSGTLTALFDIAGTVGPIDNYSSPAAVLHWYITTGYDTLLGASTPVDGGNLNLSTICVGPPVESSPTPSSTPFESFQGETATPVASVTPPPTSTNDTGSGSSTPLFALLICVAFGGLGLAAVRAQRKTIRG